MNLDPALYTLLGTAISVIVAGIVAVITAKQVGELKELLAAALQRIAVLEQVLKDHEIDLPTVRK